MFTLNWPQASDSPLSTAVFKLSDNDFHVTELINGDFSGHGEHILIRVEKRGLTTEELIRAVSKTLHIPSKLISYAGLKDRISLSTQWLSIHAPGKVIEGIETLQGTGWRVIESTRHHKKLKPGFLAGNRFKITLREVTHLEDVLQRLEQIKNTGVPNYFGEQRFGREAGNLIKAHAMLVDGLKVNDRFLKGMYLSAARSWIFNQILARRVQEHTWNSALEGDVIQLNQTNSIFTLTELDSDIIKRIRDKDLSPASPLAGHGKIQALGTSLKTINEIYHNWASWITGLEQYDLKLSWRANILHIEQLNYLYDNQVLELSFNLPPGAYATVVLRELVRY